MTQKAQEEGQKILFERKSSKDKVLKKMLENYFRSKVKRSNQ
jgi:hypothetical protein